MSDPHSTLLTVGMPVYNHAAFVGQAIGSVLDQTFGDFELIVVDDGSTDGSGRIIDDYAQRDGRIVVIHQANRGACAARNTIVARARGAWMAWLDSDDLWYDSALDAYAGYIAAHPDAKFLYGSRHRLNEDGSVTSTPGEFQDRPTGTVELFGRMHLSDLSVAYRRDLCLAAGGFPLDTPIAEDYDLYLRMSLLCRFEPIKAATGLRRRHPDCISRQTARTRLLEAEVLRRFVERHGGAKVLPPELVARRLGKLYCSAARLYFRRGCFRQAIEAAKLAHRYRRTIRSVGIALLARALLPCERSDDQSLPRLT